MSLQRTFSDHKAMMDGDGQPELDTCRSANNSNQAQLESCCSVSSSDSSSNSNSDGSPATQDDLTILTSSNYDTSISNGLATSVSRNLVAQQQPSATAMSPIRRVGPLSNSPNTPAHLSLFSTLDMPGSLLSGPSASPLSHLSQMSASPTSLPSITPPPPPLAPPRVTKPYPMQIRYKFGHLGHSKGQFSSPHGFCLGGEEEIIVADTFNHRICIFDKTGQFRTQFGKEGKEEGYMWYPRKTAVIRTPSPVTGSTAPRYVVCDRGAERSRMQIFSRDGHYIAKIQIRYVDIVAGLVISPTGHIVVVDSVAPTVFIIQETGELAKWFDCSNHMREPSDVAISDGNYYICDFKGHCVVVFNENGDFLHRIGSDKITNYPNGIDISDAGDILVGDSHGNRFHVVVFDKKGKLVSEFECLNAKVSRCCGLKITRDGFIVTLAKNNHHVLVLNTLYINNDENVDSSIVSSEATPSQAISPPIVSTAEKEDGLDLTDLVTQFNLTQLAMLDNKTAAANGLKTPTLTSELIASTANGECNISPAAVSPSNRLIAELRNRFPSHLTSPDPLLSPSQLSPFNSNFSEVESNQLLADLRNRLPSFSELASSPDILLSPDQLVSFNGFAEASKLLSNQPITSPHPLSNSPAFTNGFGELGKFTSNPHALPISSADDIAAMLPPLTPTSASGARLSSQLSAKMFVHQQKQLKRDAIASLPAAVSSSLANSNQPAAASNSKNGNKPNVMQIRWKFGNLGASRGQFSSPHGFCLGVDEEIVIADTFNHRICIFDKEGEFKYEFGNAGKDDGQMWHPRKCAVIYNNGAAASSRFVVCDRGNEKSRMQIFQRDGSFIRTISIRYIDIVAGLAITPAGEIVAVDSVAPTVFVISEYGDLLRWFDCSPYMKEPSDIAIHGDLFYICDFKGHYVAVFNSRGEHQHRIGNERLTKFPNGIDISDYGDILVGDSHGNRFHVVVFDKTGKLLSEFECPYVKVSRCCGLKITSEGYVVTLAKNNHHVLVLDTLYIC